MLAEFNGPPIEENLKQRRQRYVYPTPLSFTWRLIHWLNYLTGGIMFLIGSIGLFPSLLSNATDALSAWMYTLGSAAFLVADTMEWLMNNHVGCIFDDDYRDSYEETVEEYLNPADSWIGWYFRAENGLNFFLSACGSLIYLIGSACFLPQIDKDILGFQIFIFGSFLIVYTQLWKLYRAGRAFKSGTKGWHFALANYLSGDIAGVTIDFFALVGGFGYLIGSFAYLYSVNSALVGAAWYIVGGFAFTFSGAAMFYRYFFTFNYPHESFSQDEDNLPLYSAQRINSDL